MESLLKVVIGASNNGGKLGKLFTYVRYVLFLFTLVTFVKKFFLTRDADELRLMPDESIIPKATTISGKISRHIMKQQFKSKGLALKDYGKSLERREYEQSLDLFPKPVGWETFLIHPEPLVNYTNITAWIYDVETKEPVKLSSYDEEVPTIEHVKHFNSLTNAQVLIPAWRPEDLIDLSFVITDNAGFSSETKTVTNILLNKMTTKPIELPFDSVFDAEYNGVDDLFLEVTLKRSENCVKKFAADDTCNISITKKINLIEKFSDIDSETNEEMKLFYYNPNPLVQLIYNYGELTVSQIKPNMLEQILVDDFSGRRDNSSGIATRYFPFIQYDNFKHTKNQLISLKVNEPTKLSFNLKFEHAYFIKWRLALEIVDFILRVFVLIPFTFVESRFLFNYKLDAFKLAIFETSKNEKIVGLSLLALSSFSSVLLFFQTEARFNGNISASKSLIIAFLQLVMVGLVISNGFKYSLTAIGILVANIVLIVVRTNEQYYWRFYEPTDPKPAQFTYKKKFGLKELIAIDLYPKFNKDVLKSESTYLNGLGKQILIFIALPISTYLGGASYEKDGSVVTFFTEILINICISIILILKASPLITNYEHKRVLPYPKKLLLAKIFSSVITIYFVFTCRMGNNFKLFLLSDLIFLAVYKVQEFSYKSWKNIKFEEVEILKPNNESIEKIKEKRHVSKEFVERMKAAAAEFDAEAGLKKAKLAAEKLKLEQKKEKASEIEN
ncbi:hypothetical protein QEN19_002753 [Hanseniaspora menglaensis]